MFVSDDDVVGSGERRMEGRALHAGQRAGEHRRWWGRRSASRCSTCSTSRTATPTTTRPRSSPSATCSRSARSMRLAQPAHRRACASPAASPGPRATWPSCSAPSTPSAQAALGAAHHRPRRRAGRGSGRRRAADGDLRPLPHHRRRDVGDRAQPDRRAPPRPPPRPPAALSPTSHLAPLPRDMHGSAAPKRTDYGRMLAPPSTLSTWPLTHSPSSDTRNATMPAMSSGRPRRGTGRPAARSRGTRSAGWCPSPG